MSFILARNGSDSAGIWACIGAHSETDRTCFRLYPLRVVVCAQSSAATGSRLVTEEWHELVSKLVMMEVEEETMSQAANARKSVPLVACECWHAMG